ncbi:MAG TPA: VWA domain-containing protein [Gammaproteobacteria bacterium]|nr:VWA domain-containing protein [Gammaproteobacteria bacterium]
MDQVKIGALPILARMLSHRYDVTVRISGRQAFTNGRMIVLPSLPDDDREAVILAHGYLDHETAHIEYTDFELARGTAPLQHQLEDITEDVRIEQKRGEDLPGCRINLANLVKHLASRIEPPGLFQPAGGGKSPESLFLALVLQYGRARILRQSGLDDACKVSIEVFESVFGRERMAQLQPMLDELGQLADTAAASDLAKRLHEFYQQAMQEKLDEAGAQSDDSQCDETGDGDGGDNGQSGDGDDGEDSPQASNASDQSSGNDEPGNSTADPVQSDTSQDEADADSTNAEAGESQHDDAGEPESAGNDTGDTQSGDGHKSGRGDSSGVNVSDGGEQSCEGSGSGQGTVSDGDQGKEAVAASSRIAAQLVRRGDGDEPGQGTASQDEGDLGAIIADELEAHVDPSSEGIETAFVPRGGSAGAEEVGRTLIDESACRLATQQLRTKLASAIQSVRRERTRHTRAGKRLDRRRLHQIGHPNAKLFKSWRSRRMVNTAVEVLLDRSLSMRYYNRSEVAGQATLALMQALDTIPHVSRGCAAFPGKANSAVTRLTRPNETLRATVSRYVPVPSGSTPMHSALWWLLGELLSRTEPRRIAVVVTDGEPDYVQRAKAVLARMERAGVETVGIGINTQSVYTLFDRAVSITDVNDLPKTLFAVLGEKLTQAA